MFCEKAVLRNLAKFTGKYLCQGFTFNKVVGLRLTRCFRVIFAKFLRTPFLTEYLRWLLPKKTFTNHLAPLKIFSKNWDVIIGNLLLREKCPCSELFSMNAGKYGPE